jgi:hypothetical protein
MHKKTRFEPLQTLKKNFFKDLILVVWKYAQMHKNTFSTTSDVKKSLFSGLDSGGQEMHQNTFLTTPEVKKIIFEGLDSGGLEVRTNA